MHYAMTFANLCVSVHTVFGILLFFVLNTVTLLAKQRCQCQPRLRCAHEAFPHQKGMHACGAHALYVLLGRNAAFGNKQAVFGHVCQQGQRCLQRDVECAQIAVINANQRGCEPQRALQFCTIVHFHQYRHAQAVGNGFQLGHLGIVQTGGNQQNGIGAYRARFIDLVGVDDEVFAQHGQMAAGARLLQIIVAALEELPIG